MGESAQFVNDIQPWHWWTLGAILIAIEIASTTFYLLWPGIAAHPGGRPQIFRSRARRPVRNLPVRRFRRGCDDNLETLSLGTGAQHARKAQHRARVKLSRTPRDGVRGFYQWSRGGTGGRYALECCHHRRIGPRAGAALEVVDADGTTLKVRIAV